MSDCFIWSQTTYRPAKTTHLDVQQRWDAHLRLLSSDHEGVSLSQQFLVYVQVFDMTINVAWEYVCTRFLQFNLI